MRQGQRRPWYALDRRFLVELPENKVTHHEAEIEHWIVTNFNYDVYCIIESVKRELTDQEIHNVRINARKKNLTTTVKKWWKEREVVNSEEEIQKYIEGALAASRYWAKRTFSLFYFLSEEDAMAFKIRWS